MSTEDQNSQGGPSELELLKSRARMMGVEFSNNIGLETLKQRIADKMNEQENSSDLSRDKAIADTEVNGLEAAKAVADAKDTTPAAPAAPATKQSRRSQMLADQMKLVRLRITNLDPKKKDLHGEIFTVANEVIGTVRKFIPYGEVTDDGYHVPYILYQQLESRKFLSIRTGKDKRTGQPTVTSSWAKEFALEVLPPLTQEELNRLKTAQIAAGSVDTSSD